MDRKLVTGVILAGGQGRRMGYRNKGLLTCQGRPLVELVLRRLLPQVSSVLISANQDLARYRQLGYPVITDCWGESAGPLAGILTALRCATTPYLLFCPCDVPAIPVDLCQRLARVGPAWKPRVVHDGQRRQAALMLLHKRQLSHLEGALEQGERGLNRWLNSAQAVDVPFRNQLGDFRNINDPAELRRYRQQRAPAR